MNPLYLLVGLSVLLTGCSPQIINEIVICNGQAGYLVPMVSVTSGEVSYRVVVADGVDPLGSAALINSIPLSECQENTITSQ